MKQLILIHGGAVYDSYEAYLDFIKKVEIDFSKYVTEKKTWKDLLRSEFSGAFKVIFPVMPNKQNARYLEWKIWFEKMFPYFTDDIVFIGHSLGGIFLVKYLSENPFPKRIAGLLLVAAPFNFETKEDSLADFKWSNNLNLLKAQCQKIYIYHSEDDTVVPYSEALRYKDLLPDAKLTTVQGRGHLNGIEFPEITKDLKRLI